MKSRIYAVPLLALALLFVGVASVQGADEGAVAITGANFEATSPERDNLNDEWVDVSNSGTSDVSLTGWSLEDAQNHTFEFPDFLLKSGAAVRVHTGAGNDTEADLFWGRSSPIWNNDGDVATLSDSTGAVISVYPEESKAE